MTAVPQASTGYPPLQLYIDGRWRSGDGESEEVINPATEQPLGRLPHARREDLDDALAAAERGLAVWRAVSAYDRGKIIRGAAALIRERQEIIARALTLEQGKILAEARMEVAAAADIFEWYAEEGRRAYGRVIPPRLSGVRQMTVQEPVGVVAAFTPWNFPAVTPARKIAGALAAGCSCIIKPSEETPATCLELVRALADAGLPAGVLNLVFGVPAAVSEHLLASPVVRKVSFTGSIPVGKHLTRLAADTMKRCTMELGGHSPVLVFKDADIDKAAAVAAGGKFRNAGQVCIAPSRFYVQREVHDQFVDRFVKAAREIRIGDGLAETSTMGPLANARRLDAMDSFVADARERGANVAAGGKRHGNRGFFFEPTVVTELDDSAKLMTDEPFGPVAPITRFVDLDEAVSRANALPFGLAAYAFTESTKIATALGDRIETGVLGINSLAVTLPETPFGGMKESGYGHEGGIEGLEAYTSKKFITQA